MPTSILDLLKKGDKSGVQNEFDKGVDINAKYRFGASILNSYVDGLAKVDIVRFLLESGADVNTVDMVIKKIKTYDFLKYRKFIKYIHS